MPDITIYERDAVTICNALVEVATKIRNEGKRRVLPDAWYDCMRDYERVADLMRDRMRQGLHPRAIL